MTKGPATSGKQRLHVFWFVDAARTRKFSLSLALFYTLILGIIGIIVSIGVLVPLLFKQFQQNHDQGNYIRELKQALVHAAILDQGVAFESTTPAIKPTPAPTPEPQPTHSPQPTATPPPAPSPVATPSAVAPTSPVATPNLVTTPMAPIPTAAAPANRPTNQQQPVRPVPGVHARRDVAIEQFRILSDNPQETRMKFALVTVDPDGNRFVEGHLCVQAYGPNGESSHSLPRNLLIDPKTGFPTPAGCSRGEYVRFARFRPSSVTFRAPKEHIESVDIFLLLRESQEFFVETIRVP